MQVVIQMFRTDRSMILLCRMQMLYLQSVMTLTVQFRHLRQQKMQAFRMYHSLLLYLVETTMTDIFMWVRQMKMQEKHRVSICVMHSRMELQSCILPVHQMISSMSIVKKDWKKHLRKIQISKSLMNIT